MTRMSRGAWMRLPLALAFATMALSSGCMHVEFSKPAWPGWFEAKPEGPAQGPAASMEAMWQNGIVALPDPGRGGSVWPGFSGKILLMGTDGVNVEADGIVTVQLYDDMQTPTNPPTPREMWNIEAAVLKGTLKKDMFGWNYCIWLPWTNYSPQVNQVTLVVQYRDKSGREIWSKPWQIMVRDEHGLQRPAQIDVAQREFKPGAK